MRTVGTRELVFGLMIATVAMCAVGYAGNTAPWANADVATAEGPSTPAQPEVAKGPNTDPDTLHLTWGPNPLSPEPAPQWYSVTVDNTTQPSLVTTSWEFGPLNPGSSHAATVTAFALGNPSIPATITVKLPRAPVALGRPSVPSSARSGKKFTVSGKVVSAYAAGRASTVRLKFYRHQKTKSGKWYWDLRKTVTAKRPTSRTYSLSTRLKTADTWSVVAETYSATSHLGDRSSRSSSFKVK